MIATFSKNKISTHTHTHHGFLSFLAPTKLCCEDLNWVELDVTIELLSSWS